MATLIRIRILEEGLIPTFTTLDASNDFANTGREFILYRNASGETKTITVTTEVTTVDSPTWGDLSKTNAIETVTSGQICLIGPFPVDSYNDSNGLTAFAITPYDAEVRDVAAILYL